jgi:hypothetical protein
MVMCFSLDLFYCGEWTAFAGRAFCSGAAAANWNRSCSSGGIVDTGHVRMWPTVEKPAARGVYEIRAQWDTEAGVWVAESEDVPGLVAEADSPNVLAQKLRVLIPELLELNGVPSEGTARFHVRYLHEDSEILAF